MRGKQNTRLNNRGVHYFSGGKSRIPTRGRLRARVRRDSNIFSADRFLSPRSRIYHVQITYAQYTHDLCSRPRPVVAAGMFYWPRSNPTTTGILVYSSLSSSAKSCTRILKLYEIILMRYTHTQVAGDFFYFFINCCCRAGKVSPARYVQFHSAVKSKASLAVVASSIDFSRASTLPFASIALVVPAYLSIHLLYFVF